MVYTCALTLEELDMPNHPASPSLLKPTIQELNRTQDEILKKHEAEAHADAQRFMGQIPRLTYNKKVLNELIAVHGIGPVEAWLKQLSQEAPIQSNAKQYDTQSILVLANQFFQDCLAILKRKNADYNKSTDALSGFRRFGIRGILVRMEDKLGRIENLLDKPPQVTDESIDDTLLDVANYAFLAYACRKAGILK